MLSRLVVHLKSNTKHLTNGLKGARARVRGFGLATKAALGVAAGAVAGFAGFKALQGQLESLDRTAKLSAQTGFNAATIAGLGFGAEQSGGSVEGLNKSLQTFSRRLGEAASRGGPAADALARMGTPIQTLQGMKPEDQLFAVADGLAGIQDPGQRAAAAYELFGRQGQELLPMLSQGSAGLREFVAEADRLGLGFDAEQLASVEAANDAVNRVKRAMGALWSQVAIMASPAIEFIAGGLLWIVQKAQTGFGIVKAAGGAVWDWIIAKIQPLMPLITQLANTYVAWFTMLKEIGIAAFEGVMAAGSMLWGFIQTGLQSVMGWFGVSFGDILETAVTAYAMLEFGFLNWRTVGQLAFLQVGLGAVSFFNRLVHFFTATLPALLTWFGSNWKDVFFTAFDVVTTVFINMGQNIRNTMAAIWDFIASGGTASFEVAWTPLTDGFVNTIKKMPDLPKRVIGPLEQELQNQVTSLGSGLNQGMQKLVGERLSQLDEFRNRTNAELEDTGAGEGTDNGEDTGGGDGGGGSASTSKSLGSGLARGSEAALKAIFASQRQDRIPAQSLAEQKKQTSKLSEIAAQKGQQLQEAGPE